jgi:flagellar basal body-associated protein FliL
MKNKIPTKMPKNMKILNVNLGYIVIIAILMAVFWFVNSLFGTTDETENIIAELATDQTIESNLNDFLGEYASGGFTRVELENDVQLK